jgi:LmbE family N-acetylglucosaminyl deacetylase
MNGENLISFLRNSRVLLVAAHPDDETISAGALLSSLREPMLIHVTDGAPRNMFDALASGFSSRTDYLNKRRSELLCALAHAGISTEQTAQLGFVDQEASLKLVEITCALFERLQLIQPDAVITHSYEGGHPDHDATAFAVHAACSLMRNAELPPPQVCEMTSYHANSGEMRVGKFLQRNENSEAILSLSPEEIALKERMYRCFETQQRMLQFFSIDRERFRAAPAYNFTEAPHDGQLFYEKFDWGMTGTRWRRLAISALEMLGLPKQLELHTEPVAG